MSENIGQNIAEEKELTEVLKVRREKLAVLREALKAQDDDVVRQALMQVVPTYHDPSVVNADAISQINSQMNGTQATA